MVVNNSRFLDQYNYTEKKRFVLDILDGMTFGSAINKHSRINITEDRYVHFSPGSFHSFLRALKGSLLESSRDNTPEQRLEYKALSLHTGIEYLRERRDLILSYIQLLENEADQKRSQNPALSHAGVYPCHNCSGPAASVVSAPD